MSTDIIDFIKKQRSASICCIDENSLPYCFSIYYAYEEAEHLLYFKSSKDTHHAGLLEINAMVAGTILPDKQDVVTIKGIQFSGAVLNTDNVLCKNASRNYHVRFPFAMAMGGEVYTLRLDKIKMTDSSLGFGKKIKWDRDGEHKHPNYQQSFL